MPFAFSRICHLPWCNVRDIIPEYFVNRGVFAAAHSRRGWSELPWQGRGSGAPAFRLAARRLLVARRQRQPCRGLRGSLQFLGKDPRSLSGAARSPCLPLHPPLPLSMGAGGLPLQGALSSPGPVLAPSNHMYPRPPQSIPPVFTKTSLTSFVVASPKLAHTETPLAMPKGLWPCPAKEAHLPLRNRPALGTRNPICPLPSQDRFAYWVKRVFPAA